MRLQWQQRLRVSPLEKKFIWFNINSHRRENNKYNMHFDQSVQLVIVDKEYTRLTDRLYFHILLLHC